MGIIEDFDGEIVFKVEEMNCVDVTFCGVWFDFLHEMNCSMSNNCEDDGERWIFIIVAKEYVELMNGVIVLMNKKSDGVVKKKRNFWCKLDIERLRWSRDDIWKPNSASFLKSNWDVISVIIFSSDGIQNVIKLILKTAAIRRIDWRDIMTGSWMDRLLIALMIILLSEII